MGLVFFQAIAHHVFFWPLEQKARFLFDLGEYLGEEKLTQADESVLSRARCGIVWLFGASPRGRFDVHRCP